MFKRIIKTVKAIIESRAFLSQFFIISNPPVMFADNECEHLQVLIHENYELRKLIAFMVTNADAFNKLAVAQGNPLSCAFARAYMANLEQIFRITRTSLTDAASFCGEWQGIVNKSTQSETQTPAVFGIEQGDYSWRPR